MPAFDIAPHLENWRQQLLDTAKRNRLVSFKSGKTGGVDLCAPAADVIWQRLVAAGGGMKFPWKRDLLGIPAEILDSESLAADPATDATSSRRPTLEEFTELAAKSPRFAAAHLLTPLSDEWLAKRLNRLALTAREAATDQGVSVLYVAFGFLKWFEADDSDEAVLSPLLLAPVRLTRDDVAAEWQLFPEDDDIRRNDTLGELLRRQFKLALPEVEGEDEAAWLGRYLPAVRECVKSFARWEVLDRAAIGVFNFQKLAMWEDLGLNTERIAAHPLCRAIAGDALALPPVPDGIPQPDELDVTVPVTSVLQILDADSSQHAAIEAVKRGAHLVLDGPPGTGKSQTIANLIAEMLALGKTVLFVSEKTAALDVVRRRLEACKLGDFCLEVHSHRAHRKTVVDELGRCLKLKREGGPDAADELRHLAGTREHLNGYVRELHKPRPPLGMTAFQVHGELARLEALPCRSRVTIPDARNKDRAYLDRATGILGRLRDCRAVLATDVKHPWRNCKLTTWTGTVQDDIRFHLGRLNQLAPEAATAAGELMKLGFGDVPSVSVWNAALAEARGVMAVPACPVAWFEKDAKAAAEGVVFLDSAARRHAEFLRTAPEFSVDALRRADVAAFAPGQLVVVPPVRGYFGSVREVMPRLRDARERLTVVGERAKAADVAVKRVAESLKVRPDARTNELATFAEDAAAFARLGQVPTKWSDAARRKELIAVVSQCANGLRVAQSIRTELVARLAPTAFAAESGPLAARAAGYGSFFSRLFPGWWSLKKQVKAWYTGVAPSGGEIVADMVKLAEYHKHTNHAAQIGEMYAGELCKGDAGPDWDTSLDRLQLVERLVRPETARDALASLAKIDKTRIDREIAALAQADADVRAACGTLAQVVDTGADLTARTPRELATWAEEQRHAVETALAAFESLIAVLNPGADVETARAAERMALAAEWGKLLADAERAREAVGVAGELTDALARDWSIEKPLAERLLTYLVSRTTPLTAAHVAGLTDAAVRVSIAAAIRESEAVAAKGFGESWAFVAEDLFDPNADSSVGVTLGQLPIPDLASWCRDRIADAPRLVEWVRFVEAQRDATEAGVGVVFDEVRRGDVPLDHAADAFRARFFRHWLDAVDAEVPELKRFAVEEHERVIDRFRTLDRLSLRIAVARIRADRLGDRFRPRHDGDAPNSSELGLLMREVEKSRRHLPLRKLFAQLPTILPRLKPCLMMSPLAVSTYLQSPELVFDLVVFDEASQVRPHDAICAIYRGQQVVVAGDQKQLPPTSFFERSAEDDAPADLDTISDFESVLDVCCSMGLPRRQLRWHYRSRREGLIAFSNHHFYGGQLVTFPSATDVAGTRAVEFRFVPDGRFADGENAVEARVVANLVLDHFRDHPSRTLGVIAFSQRQQFRILDELEALRKERPELEEFFRPDRDDPFFVKNLENVQGDERDVIFLSVGYGPNASGRILMNFGPLNRKGGERRLNVAVTRARHGMTVVSSMKAGDIDEKRTDARGAKLLKAYLDFAENGPAALARAVTEADQRPFDSPFEQEVAEELTRQGLAVHRQVGCGGFRIDLAVLDPDNAGRYLLGVECDGAVYHSSATARDRDRLRQDVLEGLGWRVCRVWSTDWVRNRRAQVERVLDAVKRSQAGTHSPSLPVPDIKLLRNPSPKKPGEVEYKDIEQVPAEEVARVLKETVARFGTTGIEDLLKCAREQLGFKRMGDNIKKRLVDELNALIADGELREEDGRIRQ